MPSIAALKRGPGSACEIEFKTTSDLRKARLEILAWRKSFGNSKFVWLDFKKPNKPNRLCHRIADYLEMVEAGKGDEAKKVEKDMTFKCIKVGGDSVGYAKPDAWSWTVADIQMYSSEVREMATNFADLQ